MPLRQRSNAGIGVVSIPSTTDASDISPDKPGDDIKNRAVFPEPLGPMIPRASPAFSWKFRLSVACKAPNRLETSPNSRSLGMPIPARNELAASSCKLLAA